MSDSQNIQNGFGYFISQRDSILVASFFGPISNTSSQTIEKCTTEIRDSFAKGVVVNFHDVTDVQLSGIPLLVKLQVTIRKMPAHLRLCYIKPEVTNILDEKGAVRSSEMFENLQAALQSLLVQLKRDNM